VKPICRPQSTTPNPAPKMLRANARVRSAQISSDRPIRRMLIRSTLSEDSGRIGRKRIGEAHQHERKWNKRYRQTDRLGLQNEERLAEAGERNTAATATIHQ
jgi:hypothetical protein